MRVCACSDVDNSSEGPIIISEVAPQGLVTPPFLPRTGPWTTEVATCLSVLYFWGNVLVPVGCECETWYHSLRTERGMRALGVGC